MFGDLHIQQPSLDRPTDMQARAMRAIAADDVVAWSRVSGRTFRSLWTSQWLASDPSMACRYTLTAAGRAALERY